MRTANASYEIFSDEEKQFLEIIFDKFPHIGEKFDAYLALPIEERESQAMRDADNIPRTGWVKRNIPNPESVLEHSKELAALTNEVQLPPTVSQERIAAMALIHDLPEAIVTDFTPDCPITSADKNKLELLAARVIFQGNPDAYGLITEYDKQETETSRILHDLDKIHAVFKALQYEGYYPERMGKLHVDFLDYTKAKLKTDIGREFLEVIESRKDIIRADARADYLAQQRNQIF